MKTNSIAAALVVLAAAPLALADGPKLVNETVLMKDDEVSYDLSRPRPWSARMSPDGEHLLFPRRAAPGQAGGARPPRQGYHVVLRHWKTKKETVLPIPRLVDVDDVLIPALAMKPFSADGKLVVVPAAIDADGDGVWAEHEEMLQPALYDVAAGKLRRIDAAGFVTIATFDAAGKHLIFTVVETMRPVSGKTYVAPVNTLKPKALASWGLPRTPRPGANVLAWAEIVMPPDGGRPLAKFALYDYAKDAKVADLPLHERNTSLDDYTPQWTADGRYLYYVDVEMEPTAEGGTRRKLFRRVWDAKSNREAGKLSDRMVVGPCGGPTTMVLTRREGGAFLHDAATGREQPLTGPPGARTAIRPLSTTGKYLLYVRTPPEGKPLLCRAEIRAK